MISARETTGFVYPINHSIMALRTFSGVPADYMVINVIVSVFLTNYVSFYFFIIFPVFHLIGLFLTKKDPRFCGIFADYLKQAPFYD